MHTRETEIDGLVVVDTDLIADHRGAFSRFFCTQELESHIGGRRILQINHSLSKAIGALRGMHFQYPPHAELKCVRCVRGRVWDVALDIRQGSVTFLHWHAEELSASNRRMLIIPEGFAHGFQVLEENSELLYLHTAAYAPEAEGGLNPLDARFTIDWPLEISEMSQRDRAHPMLDESFNGIEL
jgi:dTDP-4-dehydrorhamnose 3,5-epimerase